ncbi:uncharacterized protein LOC128671854 [Plodia interpunctella]|uniref:uncharacterized protein LOC128671854 n=1 Tax=Plodia interpunctella TaxID=58824 RepID=UPI002367E57E|nr:uncharacterized protein LOC128671854 [Plodia interpunctella]
MIVNFCNVFSLILIFNYFFIQVSFAIKTEYDEDANAVSNEEYEEDENENESTKTSSTESTLESTQESETDSQTSSSKSDTSDNNSQVSDKKSKNPNKKKDISMDDKVQRTDLNLKKLGEKVGIGQIECYTCTHELLKKQIEEDDQTIACYKNVEIPTEMCGESQYCYIELNPNYIKRGCANGTPDQVFVCDSDYCNDRLANDSTYFTYPKLSDMVYDNALMNQNDTFYLLRCKSCETAHLTKEQDAFCIEGTNASTIVCNYNNLCYTKTKDGGKYVKRGCVQKPAYNSFFSYCETSKCNKDSFRRPTISRSNMFKKDHTSVVAANPNYKTKSTLSLEEFQQSLINAFNKAMRNFSCKILYFLLSFYVLNILY